MEPTPFDEFEAHFAPTKACALMADALARAGAEGARVPLWEAVELAIAHAATTGKYKSLAHDRYSALWRRFVKLMGRERDLALVGDVDEVAVVRFVDAWTAYSQPPSVATRRLRLSALRALFRTLRELNIASTDPSIDVVLPCRPPIEVRGFTDHEMELCRWNSIGGGFETRRPAVWGLLQSGTWPHEIGRVEVGDLDPLRPRVWARGGGRQRPRWVDLDPWSETQLRRRVSQLTGEAANLLAVHAEGSEFARRVSTSNAIRNIIRRAGLGADPHVGPHSVLRWLARSALDETGSIEQVALRLGVTSLDLAADLAAWRWSEQ